MPFGKEPATNRDSSRSHAAGGKKTVKKRWRQDDRKGLQPEERQVRKDKERPKLQLKNGAMADVRDAVVTLGELRAMLEVHPEKFQSLLHLAKGQPQKALPQHVQALKERRYVDAAGQVRQNVADVLLSSIEKLEEGVLVNPFKLGQHDKLVADETQATADRFLLDSLLGPRGGRGRSRK